MNGASASTLKFFFILLARTFYSVKCGLNVNDRNCWKLAPPRAPTPTPTPAPTNARLLSNSSVTPTLENRTSYAFAAIAVTHTSTGKWGILAVTKRVVLKKGGRKWFIFYEKSTSENNPRGLYLIFDGFFVEAYIGQYSEYNNSVTGVTKREWKCFHWKTEPGSSVNVTFSSSQNYRPSSGLTSSRDVVEIRVLAPDVPRGKPNDDECFARQFPHMTSRKSSVERPKVRVNVTVMKRSEMGSDPRWCCYDIKINSSIIEMSDGGKHITKMSYETDPYLERWYKAINPRNLTITYKDGVISAAVGKLDEKLTPGHPRGSFSVHTSEWKCVNVTIGEKDHLPHRIDYYSYLVSVEGIEERRGDYYVLISKNKGAAVAPSYIVIISLICVFLQHIL